jgi:hypothetical protein
MASEIADYRVLSSGRPAGEVIVHDRLEVEGIDGVAHDVAWRLVGDHLHVGADQRAFGIGRGTAWRDGLWHERHRRTEELADPPGAEHTAAERRAAEDDLDS